MKISSYIDHTLLKPTAMISDIQMLCTEAVSHEFAAVCVPPPLVRNAKKYLAGSSVRTATVIGFPFGYSTVHAKSAEVEQALTDGAHELDVVMNLIALKNRAWKYLESEAKTIVSKIHAAERVVKVIIESGVLTDDEILHCCDIYSKAGVDFLKTSTGYAEKGATIEAVRLMRENLPPEVRIKASGGIRTYEFAKSLIDAGADRLGCSASVAIVKGQQGSGAGY
jgi:deoxyribose-phosphate aldolase